MLLRWIYTWLLIGLVLAAVFIPVELYLVPFQQSLTQIIWGYPIAWSYNWVIGKDAPHTAVFSDSISFYLLLGWMFILSAFLVPLFRVRLQARWASWHSFLGLIIRLYLALHLARYGLAKLMKTQFYLPEPNTLYTPVGEMAPDLVLWSALGASPLYNMVTGLLEFGCALALLVPRLYRLASFLSVMLLAQIVLLNWSFDISVKGFSTLLLMMSLLLSLPGWRVLYEQFMCNQDGVSSKWRWVMPTLSRNQWVFFGMGCLFVGVELVWTAQAHRFQWDDHAERPPLHGAYRVLPLASSSSAYSHVFVHRRGYLILRDTVGIDTRFPLQVDTASKRYYWQLPSGTWEGGQYNWLDSGRALTLNPAPGQDSLRLAVLNWRALPLLQHPFHWTIDQP